MRTGLLKPSQHFRLTLRLKEERERNSQAKLDRHNNATKKEQSIQNTTTQAYDAKAESLLRSNTGLEHTTGPTHHHLEPSTQTHPKALRFCTEVKVMLIPTLDEYIDANLHNQLWVSNSELKLIQSSFVSAVSLFQQEQKLQTTRDALIRYQEEAGKGTESKVSLDPTHTPIVPIKGTLAGSQPTCPLLLTSV